MANELGIAAGISQGLMQGLQMYMQTKNMIEERELKKKLANAQGIDAIAKLWSVGGEDAVQTYARGILPEDQPGTGMPSSSGSLLSAPPPPPPEPQQQQTQQEMPAPPVPSSSIQSAPTSRLNLGSGLIPQGTPPMPQSAPSTPENFSNMDPLSEQYYKSAYRQPPDVRRMMLEQSAAAMKRRTPEAMSAAKMSDIELKNKQGELVDKFNADPNISQGKEVIAAYHDLRQKRGSGASDADRMFAFMKIMRNGTAPRGLDIEQLPDLNPSMYSKVKSWISKSHNNELSDTDVSAMTKAASQHILALKPVVGSVYSQYNNDQRNQDSDGKPIRDFSKVAPIFNEGFKVAQKDSKELKDVQNESLQTDVLQPVSGLLSKAKGLLFPGLSGETVSAGKLPQRGTIDDGYVFQGGDAHDKKNWKKVK